MDQRQFFLRDILTVIFKHLKLLVVLPVVILGVVFVGNYVWPPTYQATAKVQLMRGREVSQTDPTVTQASQGVTMMQMTVEDVNTEMELIHSQDVLRAVVTGTDLPAISAGEAEENALKKPDAEPPLNLMESDFPYSHGPFSYPFKILKGTVRQFLYLLKIKERPDDVKAKMDELDDRITVEPVKDSYVLDVSLELGDPKMAQKVLDRLLQVYMEKHIQVFRNPASKPFFENQKERISTDLALAQTKLQEFYKANNVSLMDIEKELLLEEYTKAKTTLTDLLEAEGVLGSEGVDAGVIQSLSSQTESVVLREMQLRLFELLQDLSRQSQSLGASHPNITSLKNQVLTMQQNLIEAIANTKAQTENKLKEIDTRLQELTELRSKSDNFEKEVEILTDNYSYYSGKLEESIVADALAANEVSNVRIVSKASIPTDPIRPNKVANLVLALLGGIVAALALAFFLDYLDHGLKTPEDVEYYVKVPPLASFFNSHGQALDNRQAERLAVLIDSVAAEGVTRVLMVTSSIGGEGSGSVASALANAYANDPNMRTLLVDLSGELARAKNARHGLTDVLLDQADFEEVFERDNNITILGRGTHSDYPPHLWGSERMKTLLTDLRARYQHILIHVGPILQSQDALTVARHVDAILLVIKADSTRREVVSRALDSFRDAKSKVIGAVMTERTQNIPQAVYRRI